MTNQIEAWKIVECDHRGMKTLFHGLNGTRRITPGEWLKADEKMVSDGTSKITYLSGWHVLLSLEDALEYMKSFKVRLDQLKIVKCKVAEIRPKEHSPSPVWLARHILFEENVVLSN